jgi:hypothetical protein
VLISVTNKRIYENGSLRFSGEGHG